MLLTLITLYLPRTAAHAHALQLAATLSLSHSPRSLGFFVSQKRASNSVLGYIKLPLHFFFFYERIYSLWVYLVVCFLFKTCITKKKILSLFKSNILINVLLLVCSLFPYPCSLSLPSLPFIFSHCLYCDMSFSVTQFRMM